MADPWIAIEENALEAVAEVVKRRPLARAELQRALHIFAIAKNRDLEQILSDMSVLDDEQLVRMAEVLVRGNQLGR